MKLNRLARYYELKGLLRSEASALSNVMDGVRNDLINAYNLYINRSTAKEKVLEMLADAKDPFSVKLVGLMNTLVRGIDASTPTELFSQVNKILGHIADNKKEARVRIHDSVQVNKQSDKNYRQHLLSKFEMVLSNLSSILEKKARVLKAFLPKDVPLAGGATTPVRKELSKEKLLMFMRSAAAQQYGLDSLEVMTKVLFYPELKEKLTTLINAIDRGHIPVDGPEIMEETKQIMEALKLKETTNQPYFEGEGGGMQRQKELEGMSPGEYQIDQMKQKALQNQLDREEEGEE